VNEIQVFDFQGKGVRTVYIGDEPWWVLKDVCEVLGLSNSRVVSERLEQDEVSQTYVTDSLGRSQDTTVVNESGLYSVILRSDKPEAKTFKKWVTSEVLPAIRRKGFYVAPTAEPTMRPLLPEHEAARASAIIMCDILNPSPSAKIVILRDALKHAGLPTAGLPAYVDEDLTRSMTDLLHEYGVPMQTSQVNLILEKNGVLTHMSRPASKGSESKFWALTKMGMLYGKNIVSPEQPRETHPHYYPGRFLDLMRLVGIDIEAMKGTAS